MQLKLITEGFFNGNGSGNGTGAVVDFTALPQADQILITLFMVLNDNRGRPFSIHLLQHILNKLIVRFGGVTVLPPGTGYWISADGTWLKDRVSLVQTVIPRTPEAIDDMAVIVGEWARELDQHEIFVYALPVYQSLDMLALSGTALWQRAERESADAEQALQFK